MNKEEIKEVIKKLQKGDNFNYYTNYGYAYSLLRSDADSIIDYFEGMEQENKELHNKIDKAIEILNNPWSFESGNKEVDEITYQKKREIIEILKDSDVDDR